MIISKPDMKNSLLLPCVFFLNFCFALLILSFFLGLTAYYELAPVESAKGLILFLHIIKTGCMITPAVTLIAMISVFHFLMRHPAKMVPAVFIFICCMVIIVAIFIPVCANLLPNIETALSRYPVLPSTDTVRSAFLNRPFFLHSIQQECIRIFLDFYAAYNRSYVEYLSLAGSVFLFVSSFWGACIATQWKMLNLMLLFFFFRIFIFLYPYTNSDFFSYIIELLHFNIFRTPYGIPIIFCAAACCIHIYNGTYLWIRNVKVIRQRRR